jgi:hypothetical protein
MKQTFKDICSKVYLPVELSKDEKKKLLSGIIIRLDNGNLFICNVIEKNDGYKHDYTMTHMVKSFPELAGAINNFRGRGNLSIARDHICAHFGVADHDDGYIKAKKMLLKELLNKLNE